MQSDPTTPPKRIWADPPETFDGMDVWRSEPGGKGVEYILASEHAALILEAEARGRSAICPDCDGTGRRDSGGTYPWGEPIFLTCDCGLFNDNERKLRAAIMWTRDRIAVDGGMTARETEATVSELLNVLLGRPSPASDFAPVADFQSPTLKAIRAAKTTP